MNNLENLAIKFVEIENLPDQIQNLDQLKKLDISGTNISYLPDGLSNLEVIDMRMIKLNREEQNSIREQYPDLKILFSSPCQCG